MNLVIYVRILILRLLPLAYKIVIIVTYRSPTSNMEYFFASIEAISVAFSKVLPKYTIIICGDFNVDILKDTASSQEFQNLLISLGCHFTIRQPTRSKACLDNFIITDQCNYMSDVMDIHMSDHLAIYLTISDVHIKAASTVANTNCLRIRRFLTTKGYNSLITLLNSMDWDLFLINLNNVADDTIFDKFFKWFLGCFNNCFPYSKVKDNNMKKSKNKSCMGWYTSDLKDMRNRILVLRTICNTSQSPVDKAVVKTELNVMNKQYKHALTEAKRLANVVVIENSKNKTKAAWSIINRNKNSNKLNPPIEVSADCFNDFFVSVGESVSMVIDPTHDKVEDLLSKVNVTETKFTWTEVTCDQVLKVVATFKSSNTMDYYGMSNNFINKIFIYIVIPFTECLNNCLKVGIYPTSFKISKVIPIYKKGDRLLPDSYRPISIISTFSKVMEVIMKTQLTNYFITNNLFSDRQYGFRQSKSTTDAIGYLIQYVLHSLENRETPRAILCDLSKAFDTISHSKLIVKLAYYGIRDVELELFRDYLSDRRQIVQVDGSSSGENV